MKVSLKKIHKEEEEMVRVAISRKNITTHYFFTSGTLCTSDVR